MKRKAFQSSLSRKRRKVTKVAKSIKKYVKKAISKEIETKTYKWTPGSISMAYATNTGLGLYVMNCTYGLENGDLQQNYIGDKIHLTGISMKYSLESYINKDAYFNYALVLSDAEISDGTGTEDWLPQAALDCREFIENALGSVSANWRFDPDNVKVLKSGKVRLRRQFSASNTFERGTCYKKLNMKFTFDSDHYSRDKNLYFVAWLSVCGPAEGDSVLLYSDFKLYFKDA